MKKNTNRIETLDWLRGLMAVSIMLYHLTLWMDPPVSSGTIIGRLGIYGVSIFFILSGLSMSMVYHAYINTINDSIKFYVRRVFRIWPLLWIATLFTIVPDVLSTGIFKWKGFLLNITTLFGFIKPTAYIAVGAWSIGNEMVYYLFTPAVFFVYNYRRRLGNLLFFITIIIGCYFASYLLSPSKSLSEQWDIYVNPFNNFFLYVMGIAMFYNFKDVTINRNALILLLFLSVLIFCFFPFSGDQIIIVTNTGRLIFVTISFFIVLFFYKQSIEAPSFVKSLLEKIGLSTYGIYILHPIVYKYANMGFPSIIMANKWIVFSGVSLITVLLSYLLYMYIELPLIRLGKKVTR